MKSKVKFYALNLAIYSFYFYIAYICTSLIRSNGLAPASWEDMEALAIGAVYVTPFDLLISIAMIIPIIIILNKRKPFISYISSVILGIIFGLIFSMMPKSIGWQLMLLTSLF
ncbi:hypothetical protein HOF56_03325 [Candidatus Peribacteria bacterium]|jgi:hypothetical protein|nr:hypothetical protein [Candidatus Peribacteria bacterium]MBT4021734.1 hypothetical protein [Candidatus Peribacteria bacterium]MBT4240607.1 hypothetical protein [Candidatus Peribacteria bacterium]MBT4474044.1 hypothetical protein [Candidatus Peribacteria bacterium]